MIIILILISLTLLDRILSKAAKEPKAAAVSFCYKHDLQHYLYSTNCCCRRRGQPGGRCGVAGGTRELVHRVLHQEERVGGGGGRPLIHHTKGRAMSVPCALHTNYITIV